MVFCSLMASWILESNEATDNVEWLGLVQRKYCSNTTYIFSGIPSRGPGKCLYFCTYIRQVNFNNWIPIQIKVYMGISWYNAYKSLHELQLVSCSSLFLTLNNISMKILKWYQNRWINNIYHYKTNWNILSRYCEWSYLKMKYFSRIFVLLHITTR